MINHIAIGPLADGTFAAAYRTPGCAVMTLACACTTRRQAIDEAERLNTAQRRIEAAIKRERELCGLHRIVTDLRN